MAFNRGALNLIASYGSDSSDDEVPGCKVSTKRTHKSSSSEDEDNNKHIRTRLPVPSSIISLENPYKDQVSDDPALHDGRIRSFPHERGNWVTFVYVPYEANVEMTKLVNHLIESMDPIGLKPVDDYHVSLTKTVVLRHHWIESFVESVKQQVATLRRFFVIFDGLQVYCNEERTRTFLGLQAITGYDTLHKLVESMNLCLSEFRLPPFYENPSFHMSIAWCVGDHEKELTQMLPMLNSELKELIKKTPHNCFSVYVSYLQCKCGNKLFNFLFSQ